MASLPKQIADANNYGKVKLSDSANSEQGVNSGVAATPRMVSTGYLELGTNVDLTDATTVQKIMTHHFWHINTFKDASMAPDASNCGDYYGQTISSNTLYGFILISSARLDSSGDIYIAHVWNLRVNTWKPLGINGHIGSRHTMSNINAPVRSGFEHCASSTTGLKPTENGECLSIIESPNWAQHQAFFTSDGKLHNRFRNNNGVANSATWGDWGRIPSIKTKTFTGTTTANGDVNTSLSLSNTVVVNAINNRDGDVLSFFAYGGKYWGIHVFRSIPTYQVTSNTSMTFTVYYYEI